MGNENIVNTLEIVNHRAHCMNWDSRGPVEHKNICSTFDVIVFMVIWGDIQCSCLDMPYNSKTPGYKAKHIEVWDSWATCNIGQHFGSSGAITWYQGTSVQIYTCYCWRQAERKDP